MTGKSKSIIGWAMYDWANSAFATVVLAGFFPIIFKTYWSGGSDTLVSTARLGFGNSIASLLVALVAPIVGAIGDRGNIRKKLLITFTYFGVVMTANLFLVQQGHWKFAICVYMLALFGYFMANVFNDALLPSVAEEKRIDFVSSLGYSLGYLGGGLLFLLTVFMSVKWDKIGFPDKITAGLCSFLAVALWWGGFTLFTIAWLPEPKTSGGGVGHGNVLLEGYRQFIHTFRKIRYLRTVGLFLLAYFFYIDGVSTIIRMAIAYGLSLGFNSNDLILALLITQFVGFPSALLYGKLAEWWDVRKCLYLAIGSYMGITILGVMMTRKEEFFLLAVCVGLVQGGIQALSRSYYSRLIPLDQAGEFYGFFNMLGKFGAILGPALMAVVGLLVNALLKPESATPEQLIEVQQIASRAGMGSILILFLAGWILLYRVDEKEGKERVRNLVAEANA